MKIKMFNSVLGYCLLLGIAIAAVMLPYRLGIRDSLSQVVTLPDTIYIMGKARDFKEDNEDFGSMPNSGFGQHAGIALVPPAMPPLSPSSTASAKRRAEAATAMSATGAPFWSKTQPAIGNRTGSSSSVQSSGAASFE